MNKQTRDAVAEALGYCPDDGVIASALDEHADTATTTLRTRLRRKEAEFRQAGGRGVDLADEIDSLRIALAVRKRARPGGRDG
jgi:hypothetical protein